ncbi:MAG TPA: hypothetical protein VKA89_06130 [Solirubrobacterales bacterium]|nr:hypothetical protein [Solirubrobacterales bacterium]
MAADREHRAQEGTASVELVASLPALVLALLIAAQLAAAGHALWSAGIAARAGARAALVGNDPARSARGALPGLLRRGSEVRAADGVRVTVSVPRLLPGLPPIPVAASAALGPGAGG